MPNAGVRTKAATATRAVARVLALLLLLVRPPAAQAATISVDGRLDEPAWANAQVFGDFVVTEPFTRARPTHPTEARILGTPEGIAVGYRVTQPAAATRLKPFSARDDDNEGDRVNLYIDFNADGVTAYNVTVALAGSVQDATITNENQYSADWDGDWQTAVDEQADGWSVEILVPWNTASMRDSGTPTRTVAVLFDRVFAATRERSAFPAENFSRQRYVSNFHRVEIAQFRQASFDLFPYVSTLADLKGESIDARFGLDLFWKPSGDFQLAAALNPDFGQVEADDLVVNFEAIESFFSDKRPFFTENQGLFDLRTPNSGLLVYTRRIGGPRDDGEPGIAEIDAAVKVIGAAGRLNYGVLSALESDYADDIGSAFYVQRLTYPLGDATLGYLGTWADRPALDRRGIVHAVDLTWRPSSSIALEAQVVQAEVDTGSSSVSDGLQWFRLDLTPAGAWRHELEVSHFGADLDFNDLGFQPRASLNELEWTTTYVDSTFGAGSALQSVQYTSEPQLRYNDEGDRLPAVLEASAFITFRDGGTLLNELRYQFAGIDDLLTRGNGNVRLAPRPSWYFLYESPRVGDWSHASALWFLHEGLDDWSVQVEQALTWFASERVTASGRVFVRRTDDWLVWDSANLLGSYARDQLQASLDATWLPAPDHELRAKLQWFVIDADDPRAYRVGADGIPRPSDDALRAFGVENFGLQLRYRWTFAAQSDLFVVYTRGGFALDDGADRDRGLGDLFRDSLDLRDSDQFLVKLRYRF